MNNKQERIDLVSNITTNLDEIIAKDLNGYCPVHSILGSGAFTTVFEIYPINVPTDDFRDPVLVMSLDQEKADLFEAVTGLKTFKLDSLRLENLLAETEKEMISENEHLYSSVEELMGDMNVYDYVSPFEPSLYFEEYIQNDICLYITEKVENEFSETESTYLDIAIGIWEHNKKYGVEYTEEEVRKLLDHELTTGYLQDYLLPFEFSLENIDFNLMTMYVNVISRDISIMREMLSHRTISLDLHEGQFIKHNNKVFLIDSYVIG